MKQLAAGIAVLLFFHALVVAGAWFYTSDVPLNGHVLVLALLGLFQLVYAVPLIAVLLFKRKRYAALGVAGGAVLTAVVSGIGLTL